MEKSYSKHKEASPEQTVQRIVDLLSEHGINLEVVREYAQSEKTFSNRIQVRGLMAGTNGKGMTREYALASGYAEFMERIENGLLASRHYDIVTQPEFGFYHHPDEVLVDAGEYL